MFLLLHITRSCIFHAYVLLFSIILILIVFGSLLLISLSLSLFLLVSLRMTPKHKSIPSRNPLCSRAASSSNPTPSSVWFLDEKACQDFLENFSRSGIHSEHQVILSNFSDRDLPTIIYCRGWESLYNISDTCPSMIILEFYSNMHEFNYFVPHFITRV